MDTGSQFLTGLRPTTNDENLDAASRVESASAAVRAQGVHAAWALATRRQTSDRPIAKLVFWSIRTTVCPEAYIDFKVDPGQEAKWNITYDFYTLPQ